MAMEHSGIRLPFNGLGQPGCQGLRIGLGILTGAALLTFPAVAVEFPDGRVAFDIPPYLNQTYTPYTTTFFPQPTYFFGLSLATTAGEPLERVVIRPLDNQEDIYFVPNLTQAWLGKPHRNTPRAQIASVEVNPETFDIEIQFNPPLPPGSFLTIGVSPYRNPALDGVYQFSVVAYPRGGAQALGQEIGTGRLQFYRTGDR